MLTSVIAALEQEIRPLAARLIEPRPFALEGAKSAIEGFLGGRTVLLVATGDGARRAQFGLESLLSRRPVGALLIIGLGGGLSPELELGEIVSADEVRTTSSPEVFRPDPELTNIVQQATGALPGMAVSAPRLVVEPELKWALWTRFGHPAGAVVDLESAAFAGVARAAGRPWALLRAISDRASDGLPSFLADCVDESGSMSRYAVARHAIRHPSSWVQLRSLSRHAGESALRLASAVEALSTCVLPG
jgi:nucleoside phosphorylase